MSTQEHPIAHATVSVVVDGALEEEHTFTDEALLDEFVNHIRLEAEGEGYPTEVFRLDHYHAIGEECECAQYAQSHLPYASWNTG